jgi:pimeloyl-ACP methyl ester carboxylesterase
MGHGRDAWQAQLPLADRWRLLIVDRTGFGRSPDGPQAAEAQADDLAALIPDGADVVGHSYGGMVALTLAGRHPGLVRSLTLIEPPALGLVKGDDDVAGLIERTGEVFQKGLRWSEERALRTFLMALGFDPGDVRLGDIDRRDVATSVREPAPWTIAVPLGAVVEAGVKALLVTGGWPAGETIAAARSSQRAFAAVSRLLVERLRAEEAHFPAANHDVQSLGAPFNERLVAFVESG